MSDWLLVVDDDADGRELLAELLAMSGFDAVACANADEANAVLDRRGRPRVVLTDLLMPDVPGTTFVTRMRNRPGFSDVPVVFVTGIEPSMLGDCHDPILKKPFDIDRLIDLVAQHCGRARSDAYPIDPD